MTPNGENTYKLTISGTGAMGDLKGWAFGSPWNFALILKEKVAVNQVYYAVTELEIADGITEIGAHAFEAHRAITHVALPQSVTKIGEKSFNYCTGMQSIVLSNNLEEIGSTALSDTALTSIELPESLKKIQNGAFSGCNSLAGDLKIPSNVTVIGNAAFANDTALTGTLTIGNSVQTIGDSAFSGCKFTGKLTIPDSVISIGDNAFTNNKFSEISLGRNLEKIGGSAFNTSGTYTGQLNIPDSVKEIGKSAFNGMGFTSIRLGKSVSSIADTAFQNCTSIHSLDISSIGSADYGTNVFKSLKNPNTIYVNSEEQKNTITNQITENRSVFAITNGGVFAENTTFEEGKLATPEKADYTFKGWYDNEGLTGDPVTAIGDTETGNKEYWAKWEINQYTITVKPENGEADITITQDYGTPITAPTLTREGYQFNGWDKAFPTTMPAEDLTITAQWRDIAVPTGEIKIAENDWKSFFNTITFDLFFKDTQMVTVTAADNSGEAVTVEYLLNDKALTESELAGMTFTAYSAPFSINPDNEYVIYAKLTDTSGNVAYINTNGIVLDATVPVISGIEAGKTYCAAQTVTVTEKYISTVKVNSTEVSLDKNSQFALSHASGKQTIVVTDKAGNETKVTVTVNDGHTYEWQSENGQYWQKCKFCNHETAKKDIPTINISGADKVCRTQDYKFSFTLPEGATDAACGYEFIGLGGAPLTPTVENGLYSGIIKASTYPAKENSFKLIVSAKTADGFAFSAEKKVTIQNEHTGGTATCKDKAKCEVCGERYGDIDRSNHVDGCVPEWTVTETEHTQKYSRCGKLLTETGAHTFGDWTVTQEPTESEKGEQERVCTLCGCTETEAIPAAEVEASPSPAPTATPGPTAKPAAEPTEPASTGSARRILLPVGLAGVAVGIGAGIAFRRRKKK